jgi:hypothetical protein
MAQALAGEIINLFIALMVRCEREATMNYRRNEREFRRVATARASTSLWHSVTRC